MGTFFYAPSVNFKQTTLNGSITSGQQTITLNSTANLTYPGYVVIDRQDSAGNNTPSAREVVSYTGIAGNDLTGCTRGADNGSALAHNNNALVETMPTVGMWNSLVSAIQSFVDPNGYITAINSPVSIARAELTQAVIPSVASVAEIRATRVFAGSATITSLDAFVARATITGSINASGASVVGFGGTGGLSAVWQVGGGLASLTNAGGLNVMPAAYTGQFMQLIAQTPASAASIYVTLNKNSATYGVIGLLAQATFASSASISTPALVAGDTLTMDVLVGGPTTTRYLGSDLTLLLRGT